MKTTTLALLTLAAGAPAAALPQRNEQRLAARQLEGLLGGGLSSSFPVIKPFDTTPAKPAFRKNATREIVRYGPLVLRGTAKSKQGVSLDPAGTPFSGPLEGICSDCVILAGATYLTYANGTKASVANGVYNHHVFVGDIGKSMITPFGCPGSAQPAAAPAAPAAPAPAAGMSADGHAHGSGTGMPSAAAPQAAGGISLPLSQIFGSADDGEPTYFTNKEGEGEALNTGFYIAKSDIVFHFSEFVNYHPEDQEVFMNLDVEYFRGKPAGHLDASITALNAAGCKGIMYVPPANAKSTLKSEPFIAQSNGLLFDMKAHLHDGGVAIRIYVNEKLVCESTAIYGGKADSAVVGGEQWATITGIKRCDKPVKIKKGDKVIAEAEYDTVAHPLRPGAMDASMKGEAMGLMGALFATEY